MIELKSIYKSFEDKDVLIDISTRFEQGKTNLIIGQSGSGKTVLMKSIVGLLTPDRGEILYDGRNFLTMGKKEKKFLRREMGMIFQSAALFDSLTVLENVMFPLDMFSNDTYRDRVRTPNEERGLNDRVVGGLQSTQSVSFTTSLGGGGAEWGPPLSLHL